MTFIEVALETRREYHSNDGDVRNNNDLLFEILFTKVTPVVLKQGCH